LTAKAIENFAPTEKRREIPDGKIRGLHFILQPSGARSWAFRYRIAGKSCKLTLGSYPALSLQVARQLAGEAAQLIARGEDPAAKKQEARAAAQEEARREDELVENIVTLYVDRHLKRNTRERTQYEVQRVLNREIVGRWRGRRLSSISMSDVHALLGGIVDRGKLVLANRTLSIFSRLCVWAMTQRKLITANPCAGISPPATETSRDRILSDAELAAVWRGAEELDDYFGAIIQLLILTGQRRQEVNGMM
jgi:integrase